MVLLTSDQLSCHFSDAAAGLSYSFDKHRVALSTEQLCQVTGGPVGLTGDVVT